MPLQSKFTHEEILNLHDEWKKSGLDLKTFCATHTPTPLNYNTIYARFRRLEKQHQIIRRKTNEYIEENHQIAKALNKHIQQDLIKKVKTEHDFLVELGKEMLNLYKTFLPKIFCEKFAIFCHKTTQKGLYLAWKKGLNIYKPDTLMQYIETNKDFVETLTADEELERLFLEIMSIVKTFYQIENPEKEPTWNDLLNYFNILQNIYHDQIAHQLYEIIKKSK
jgi:hypothetical protein